MSSIVGNPLYDAIVAGRSAGNGNLLTTPDGNAVDDTQFLEQAARLAAVLADVGVQPGDRVAVQVSKSWQALALYVACLRHGAVFLPLNTAYTPSELAYFLDDAEPALFVVDPDSGQAAQALADDAASDVVVLTLGGNDEGSLADAARTITPAKIIQTRTEDDIAAILYTSGTTGRSKGAMLTQRNLLSNAQTLIDAWQFSASDVLLHALPIFHTHGLFVAGHCCLMSGARMQFHSGFKLDAVIADLPYSTVLMGVPTFYTRLLDDARFTSNLVAHMRLFVSGSAPLLAETHHQFEQRTSQRILERYGMTETNMSCSNPYAGERRAGTVGPPLPGVEARLSAIDPDTGVGTLEVRGDNVFKGYWRMPEKTAEELAGDGWFLTGDLATIDESGYVTIVGRGKDLVISGGYNIYPKEIEMLLDSLDGVSESAVVGAPHPDFGESVVGFVVLDSSGKPQTEEALLAGIADRLARFKQPRRLFVVPELPRNTMGKVQKNILRDQVSGLFC
jgi:malonyl-CoA/methylmalonyl-CoA synthetase